MGVVKRRWLIVGLLFVGLCIVSLAFIPMFGRVHSCGKTRDASNLRSLSICHAIRYDREAEYKPDSLQTMEDFLRSMAEVDLTDTDIFLNRMDRPYFGTELLPISAYRNNANEVVFDDTILDYPMGFSLAVYPDLDRPVSTTPILWTRDLERYATFDHAYGGYVAFLDGHVEYLEGVPNEPDPRLEALFGVQGEVSQAVRALRHVPDDFAALGLDPLPVRFYQEQAKTDWRPFRMLLVILSPGLLAGLLVFLVNKKSGWARWRTAGLAFVIVEIVVLFVMPLHW